MLNINDLRREYRLKSLDLNDLSPSPFMQFCAWFEEARQGQVLELNAMALATASAEGRPSCRTVLLKEIDTQGFIFFTNYDSRKGQELAENPFGSAVFYWAELERQVILEGGIKKLTVQESERYFDSRPRGSQLGTWASHQDQILFSRAELEKAYRDFEKKFEGKTIPRPPYWGGYRLIPERFEFWQGRSNRLHDRFRYLFSGNTWKIDRLAP